MAKRIGSPQGAEDLTLPPNVVRMARVPPTALIRRTGCWVLETPPGEIARKYQPRNPSTYLYVLQQDTISYIWVKHDVTARSSTGGRST